MKIQKPTTSTDNMTDFTDKRFVTDAEKTKLSNTSGTNTGDQSSFTFTLTAGENLVAGNICYLKVADGKYWKADADAEATASTKLVMAIASISADATGLFLEYGRYTTSGLTAGIHYLSGTAGASTTTAPTGTGKIVRIIGTAESTTVLFFNPDSTYLELA